MKSLLTSNSSLLRKEGSYESEMGLPSLRSREGRPAERSRGESNGKLAASGFYSPVIASPDCPVFTCGGKRRGQRGNPSNPLCAAERVSHGVPRGESNRQLNESNK